MPLSAPRVCFTVGQSVRLFDPKSTICEFRLSNGILLETFHCDRELNEVFCFVDLDLFVSVEMTWFQVTKECGHDQAILAVKLEGHGLAGLMEAYKLRKGMYGRDFIHHGDDIKK